MAKQTKITTKNIKTENKINLISRIFLGIFALIFAIFIFRIALSNILPAKIFWPVLLILIAFLGLFAFSVLKRNPKKSSFL